MQKIKLDKVTFELPHKIVSSVSNAEIIELLIDKAMSKREYFLTKSKMMEDKYHTSFENFKEKIKTSSKETFGEWDDFILWESYEMAFNEWDNKYKELILCIE